MNKKEDRLLRGSIRVFRDARFYEERKVQQVTIRYNELMATLHVTAIPKDLQEIFEAADISWIPDTHSGSRLKSVVKGLTFDDIESADENHLRIKFSGLTQSEVKAKLDKAIEWLDEQGIERGEKDGKVACIFKCVTSQQLEMGEF